MKQTQFLGQNNWQDKVYSNYMYLEYYANEIGT